MASKGIFPSSDADFNVYINNAFMYLNNGSVKSRLVTTPAANAAFNQVNTAITTANTGWNSVYPQSQNPAVRTRSITESKNLLREQIESSLRIVYGDIPNSILTQADRDTLGISAPNTTSTPAPVPSTKPLGNVDTGQRLQHTISFVDSETPTSRAKPNGVRGCQIWVKIGSPANDVKELTFIGTATRSPYVLHFEAVEGGKAAYYWLRWENTRGEVGPWSDVVMATIPA